MKVKQRQDFFPVDAFVPKYAEENLSLTPVTFEPR